MEKDTNTESDVEKYRGLRSYSRGVVGRKERSCGRLMVRREIRSYSRIRSDIGSQI